MAQISEPRTPNKLIGRILATREREHGYRKQLMCGINETEEQRAIPYVYPYSVRGEEQALLRAAALTARWREIPQTKKPVQIGFTLAQASRNLGDGKISPDSPDMIARQLSMLEHMDLDEATATFDHLLGQVQAAHLPFDFFGLTRLLSRWGNGMSHSSVNVRRSIMRTYWNCA